MVHHFWQSIDAIVEDAFVTETIYGAELSI